MHIAKILASRIPNEMIRARTRASDVTDRLRHGRATVDKLCDMGNSVFTSAVCFSNTVECMT
jgi:hypothetical protein